MKYRQLGPTGMFVSELCLGTMTFGGKGGFWPLIGQLDQSQVNSLIARALSSGVNIIDTADVYSEGESERMVGAALRDLKVRRDEIVIATKVRGRVAAGPNSVGLSRGHIMDAVRSSLDRLGVDHIDLYQIHGADLVTPIEETLRALDDLVRQGFVRYVGCSNLAAWQIAKALGICRHRGWERFVTVQAYYTIANRELEREIIPLMQEEGLGLMVWSPLAGGLLSGKFGHNVATPNDARRASFDFPPVDKAHGFDIVDVMRPIAHARGISVARIVLAWILQQRAVMSVIIGAKTPEQLDDNLAASDVKFTIDEMAALEKVSALQAEYPQWMIARLNSDRIPS
jgi:aryl-alcohol dehydrogenase-like predicted oxidoreductase